MSLSSDKNFPLSVKPTPVIVICWISITVFILFSVMSIGSGAEEVLPIFILFIALGIYMLLAIGRLDVDKQLITYRTPLACYQIRWDELSHIEIDKGHQWIVFCGSGKRLAVLGPTYWAGDTVQMLELMATQVETYQIEGRRTPQSLFRWSKNTKIHS